MPWNLLTEKYKFHIKFQAVLAINAKVDDYISAANFDPVGISAND